MISDYIGGFNIVEGKEYLTAINFDDFTTIGYTLLTIYYNNTELFDSTFMDCTSLTSVHIPKSFEIIPNCMFQNCTSLSSVTIDEGVKEIQRDVFKGCESLSEIVLPESLEKLKHFTLMKSLKSIIIPANVKEINIESFYGCPSLKTVTFKSKTRLYTNLPYLADGSGDTNIETLYVQPNLLNAYKTNYDWKVIADKIKPIVE